MDVSSRITAAVSHLAAVSSASNTTQADRVAPPPPPPPEKGAATQLSRPGRLISKLSQLRDSAPDQFKQAVSTIASELRSVSEQDSGMGAKMLVDLANKLDQAASDVEASEPPRAGANRAAVDAYRATADAHASSAAGPGLSRALDSLDAAATGAEPRRL